MKIKVTSDRWSKDEVICTLDDLLAQARDYTNDRIGKGEFEGRGPVTFRFEGLKIFDDTGDLVGEVIG
jgi:hypothetical protein